MDAELVESGLLVVTDRSSKSCSAVAVIGVVVISTVVGAAVSVEGGIGVVGVVVVAFRLSGVVAGAVMSLLRLMLKNSTRA